MRAEDVWANATADARQLWLDTHEHDDEAEADVHLQGGVCECCGEDLARDAMLNRLIYVETMLGELAQLEEGVSGSMAGRHYDVDEVHRDERGRIMTVFGTAWSEKSGMTPFILGEV